MTWLDGVQNPGGPGHCPDGSVLSLKAWNLMDGLDWAALETVADVLGINDIEALIEDCTTIRDWQKNRKNSDG